MIRQCLKVKSCLKFAAEEGAAVKRKMAQEKAQKAAELVKEADAQQQAAKEDSTDIFPQYQAAKKEYQDSKTNFLKLLKSLLLLRGSTAATLMASFSLKKLQNLCVSLLNSALCYIVYSGRGAINPSFSFPCAGEEGSAIDCWLGVGEACLQ